MERNTRYLLTTSQDKDVIIAEVPANHSFKDRGEYIVSQSFVDINVKNKNFTEVTGKLDWNGQIWVLRSDFE